MHVLPRIAITSGEPAGIGPELCVMLAQNKLDAEITVIGDARLLNRYGLQTNSGGGFGVCRIIDIPAPAPIESGKLNPDNSRYVLQLLNRATAGCLNNEFDAMVTAPVHKGVINDAGIAFIGHTEYLAALTNTPQVVMMLVGGGLRVALATTHLALKDVPSEITQKNLETTIRILHADLIHKFGLQNPRILVCGLNPHAGEGGYLGDEEIRVINPVLEKLRAQDIDLIGALPADTLFTKRHLEHADAVLAMYHDQGLSVLKYASFGQGVNVTLGLPINRTSVDHGTALDLAGTGKADPGSMVAAVKLAIELARKHRR